MKRTAADPEWRAWRIARRLLVASLLVAGAGWADVPTPAEECRLRNAAICELNGVRYVVDGPCPAAARTIRPPGSERCDEAPQKSSRGEPSPALAMLGAPTAATAGTVPAPGAASAPHRDLAWVGRIERWLLPLLLAVGGVLLCGLALLVVRWRWRVRQQEHAGTGVKANADVGRSLLQLGVAGVCAVPLGYFAALAAFHYVFSSADNHDSALPWLLAAPLAVVVFLVVCGFAFALIGLLLGGLFRGRRRQLPDDGADAAGSAAKAGQGSRKGSSQP